MRRLLLIAVACVLSWHVKAQGFDFGSVSQEELDMKHYAKDTSAHAVVLNEYGVSKISFDNDYRVRLTYEYHTKIKFFDNKEFENHGTFKIPVYNGESLVYEDVDEIKGVTYYKDDAGNMQQAVLDKKNIFTTRDTKHWSTVKFAMPALKSGCVVEVLLPNHISIPFQFSFLGIPGLYSKGELRL